MDELAQRFEANRTHLRSVVQEAWLRLSRSSADDVDSLRGWLTTVVARICLDALRARKLRARRRVHGSSARPQADHTRQREVVSAFLAAARGGDFTAPMAALDPDVVLNADAFAVQAAAAAASKGAPQYGEEVHGAAAVAEIFKGRAQAARLATLDGAVGAVYAPGGVPRVAFEFAIEGGRIVGISIVADPGSVRRLEVRMIDD